MILEDYCYPLLIEGKIYVLNKDPITYARENVKKYWPEKIEEMALEIRFDKFNWGQEITQKEAEELAIEKLSEAFLVDENFLQYFKQDGYDLKEKNWQETWIENEGAERD